MEPAAPNTRPRGRYLPRTAGVVAVCVLSALYVFGPPPPEGGPDPLVGWDKLGHLLGFTSMTAVWALSCRRAATRLAVPLAAALLLEATHAVKPERMLSLGDVVANLAGVALGLGLARLWGRKGRR